MKKIKKVITLIMIVILVVSVQPSTTKAAGYDYDAATKTLQLYYNYSDFGEYMTFIMNSGIPLNDVETLTIGDGEIPSSIINPLIAPFTGLKNLKIMGDATFESTSTTSDGKKIVEFGDGAFAAGINLEAITIDVDSSFKLVFGNDAFSHLGKLKAIKITNESSFGHNAFGYCPSLTDVALPNAKSFDTSMFSNCTSLIEIDLPNVISVTHGSFGNCEKLESISMANATTFGNSNFSNLQALTSVNLPNATTFENGNFSNLPALTSIYLPKAETFIYSNFNSCPLLTNLDLPKATTFESGNIIQCDTLATVNLPSVISFGDVNISNCNNLTTVNLSSIQTFGSGNINSCNALTSVNLPNLKTTYKGNISNCSNLTMVNLPSVTSLDDDNLSNCAQNLTAKFGTTVPTATDSFAGLKNNTESVVAVPAASLEEYDLKDSIDDGLFYGITLRAISSANQITAFNIPNQVSSSIDEGTKTINAVMPYGTDLTNLIPSIYISDYATVTPNNGAAQNLTSAIIYTVTSEAGTVQSYTVKVSVQEKPAENVTPSNVTPPNITPTTTEAAVQKGTIKGRIVDESGNPVSGITVTLHSDPVTVVTDSNGEFIFKDVELTNHTLIITNKNGTEIGRYTISFTKGSSSSYTLSNDTLNVNYTDNATGIKLGIVVNDSLTSAVIKNVSIVSSNVLTGDTNNMVFYWAALISAMGVIAYCCYRRKTKLN